MEEQKELMDDWEFLRSFAKRIREAQEFDSVFIIATRWREKESDTVIVSANSGNGFASVGAIEEYLVKDRERAKIVARKDSNDDSQ